jgi:hypothetical protein
LRDSVSKSSAHFAGFACMLDCETPVQRDMDFSAEKAILKLLVSDCAAIRKKSDEKNFAPGAAGDVRIAERLRIDLP